MTLKWFGNTHAHASADYRCHIVGGLFKDVIGTAWNRAE